MIKLIFVSLIFLLTCVNTNAQINYNPAYSHNNFSGYNNQYYQDYDIDALENYTFNKRYVRDNNMARLQRLEMQTFGAVQQGDFNTRYQNVRSAILARPKQNHRKSILRSMNDYFSGQLTGFTPLINPYIIPQTNFSNIDLPQRQYQTYYSSPFSHGYRVKNYDTGSSGSVRILD